MAQLRFPCSKFAMHLRMTANSVVRLDLCVPFEAATVYLRDRHRFQATSKNPIELCDSLFCCLRVYNRGPISASPHSNNMTHNQERKYKGAMLKMTFFRTAISIGCLLTMTGIASADTKVKSRQTNGGQTYENTSYIKGKRQRSETNNGQMVVIQQCDLRRNIQIMPDAKMYMIQPYDDPAAPLATHRPAVVLAEGSDSMLADALASTGSRPDAVVWRGDLPEGHDLGWEVLMRAGRTDPAPTAEVAVTAEAFVIGDRTITVREALEDDTGPRPLDWPLDAIGTLVSGGVVLLSLP